MVRGGRMVASGRHGVSGRGAAHARGSPAGQAGPGGAAAGVVPKERSTTTIVTATITAVIPEVQTLASAVPAAWEIRPVSTGGTPRPR